MSLSPQSDPFKAALRRFTQDFHATLETPGDRSILDRVCVHIPGHRLDEGFDAKVLRVTDTATAQELLKVVPKSNNFTPLIWDPAEEVTLPEISLLFLADRLVDHTKKYSKDDFRKVLETTPALLDGWVQNGSCGFRHRKSEFTYGRYFEKPHNEPLIRAALILIGIYPPGDPSGHVISGVPEPRTLTLTKTQLEQLREGAKKA